MSRREDAEFMTELRAAAIRRPRLSANLLLLAIVGFVVWAIWWANGALLDEVTRGMGRVVPSSQVQVVQNLEGGIVSEIRIHEGDFVAAGQVLIVVDDTQFRSKFREDRSKELAFEAAIARLRAEVEGRALAFPEAVRQDGSSLVANEAALYEARQSELDAAIRVLRQQRAQKIQELQELGSRIGQLRKSLALGQQELDIIKPIVAQGAMAEIELVRLRREVTDIESSLMSAQQAVPRLKAAIVETEQQVEEKKAGFLTRVRTELNEAESNLRALRETMLASEDRLRRTVVVAPVNGTVKQVLVNTVGGVIRPGMDLVEIVSRDDTLLVEARVRPADVAFLRPGQAAKVKITAYDYAIYGMLDAELEHISADSIVNPEGESFYEIRVRTRDSSLRRGSERFPIKSGMVAEVDILTGSKTVLEYLIKPILRARHSALTER